MKEESERKIHFNGLQLIVAFLGAVLLFSLIAYLVYQIATGNWRPPELRITYSHEPQLPNNSFKVVVENVGAKTARSVNIMFGYVSPDGKTQTTTMVIDYIPARSTEEGWVVFYTGSVGVGELKVLSANFLKP